MNDRRPERKSQGVYWPLLKAEWRNWYSEKKPVLIFAVKFGVLIALFYGLLATSFFDHVLYSYLQANAWLANAILNALGQASHVSDVVITSPRFSMAIRRGCDAVEPTWLFCAAILAFPSPLLHKLWGMLAGIFLLQFLNLLRIVSLYWIGIYWPSFFNSAHVEIWPVLFIVAALLLFLGWRRWPIISHQAHAA